MKTFKTFETFEPKKVKERITEKESLVKAKIVDALPKIEAWKKIVEEVADVKKAIAGFVKIYISMNKQDKAKSVETLEQIHQILEAFNIEVVQEHPHDTQYSAIHIENLLMEAKKLRDSRDFSFTIDVSLKRDSIDTLIYAFTDDEERSVIFQFDEGEKFGDVYFKGLSLMNSMQINVAPNGNDKIVVWFNTVPRKFAKILDVIKNDPRVTVVQSTTEPDHYDIKAK
jgi:hypothetical protein